MKWLLALLALHAAKSIDHTRPFACGTAMVIDHQSGETIHKNLCRNWKEPFLLTAYEEIPEDIERLCTPIHDTPTTLTENNRYYEASIRCISFGSKNLRG